MFYFTDLYLFSISIVFSCSFLFATLHNLNAGNRNIELKKSIIACFPSKIGVTAFHIHCLSLLWDHIRGIHQIRGFMELKSASVTVTVIQDCCNRGHLVRCGHQHTYTHTHTCTREPLTPIPSCFTLSRLYLLQGGSHEKSCRPRVSLPVIPLDCNDTPPLNCHWPIMTSRTFKILTYGSWGGSSLHLAGDDRCGLTSASWDNAVQWKCDPSSCPTPDASTPSLVGKFYTDGGHKVKTVKCLVESHLRGVGEDTKQIESAQNAHCSGSWLLCTRAAPGQYK